MKILIKGNLITKTQVSLGKKGDIFCGVGNTNPNDDDFDIIITGDTNADSLAINNGEVYVEKDVLFTGD